MGEETVRTISPGGDGKPVVIKQGTKWNSLDEGLGCLLISIALCLCVGGCIVFAKMVFQGKALSEVF